MTYPVPLCSDHAEFEREHIGTRPEDRPDWPLPSFDASDWAKAFCQRVLIQNRAGHKTAPIDDDVATMITWFSAALMRGFDEHAARMAKEDIMVTIKFKRLPHGEGLPLPGYARFGDAGMDLHAAIHRSQTGAHSTALHDFASRHGNAGTWVILPREAPVLVPTGFAIEIPPGFEGQIRPRSGLAAKTGLTIANSPGTVDSGFRGECMVALINNGPAPVEIQRGDRIAQLVIAAVANAHVAEVAELSDSERGDGGFGSTGR